MDNSLSTNLQMVKENIANACLRSNRKIEDITLIAVTKNVDSTVIKELKSLGVNHFAENRIQIALEKRKEVPEITNWHFIGNIQSRKVKDIITNFPYIHSIDRLSIAQEIDKRSKQLNLITNGFLQVNVAKEETKSGVKPEELFEVAKKLSELENLNFIGLMTMAPLTENKDLIRKVFHKLKELMERLKAYNYSNFKLNHLSMGMSNDYEIAVEEGATMLRIGTALIKK